MAEIDVAQQAVDGIAATADTFSGSVSTFQGAVSGVRDSVLGFAEMLEGFDGTFYDLYKQFGTYLTYVTLAVTIFFGVLVGLSVLVILGALLMTFCEKYKCRYLIYFSCCLLIIFGIVGFLLSIIFSAIVPALYFSCEFISFTI